MYVIRKSSILGLGPLVVTRFDGAIGAGAGPFTPQGVDNFDPAATTGYFIGVDNADFSKLDLRTVSDPGGTPTHLGQPEVTVPTTRFPTPSTTWATPVARTGDWTHSTTASSPPSCETATSGPPTTSASRAPGSAAATPRTTTATALAGTTST